MEHYGGVEASPRLVAEEVPRRASGQQSFRRLRIEGSPSGTFELLLFGDAEPGALALAVAARAGLGADTGAFYLTYGEGTGDAVVPISAALPEAITSLTLHVVQRPPAMAASKAAASAQPSPPPPSETPRSSAALAPPPSRPVMPRVAPTINEAEGARTALVQPLVAPCSLVPAEDDDSKNALGRLKRAFSSAGRLRSTPHGTHATHPMHPMHPCPIHVRRATVPPSG